ncbi:MAG: 2-dehydropantoate 2-reductase [Bacillus sp. (in: Bacteria)]|nr:2-dehydropantoate 2-reductase [Bacillus sp. (in: firmicutes)]MCM1425180.1 2-dehydropantoate 2-reductase [Eubacterium sp.]
MNTSKKKIENIDIVGLGALGVMYADFFTKKLGKEHVRVLADAARIERYQKDAITFNGQICDFNYLDAAKESRTAELILFTVKYGALEAAMEEVAHLVGKDTILLSALNGIRSEADLGRKFGAEKVVHCIAQKMDAMKEKNIATCKNKGELALGILNGGKEENLAAVKAFFDEAGFVYSCPEDMRHMMWAKLLCNVGVNQTVSLYAGTYRTVQKEGEAREMMKAAMRETILVANAEGVDLTEKDLNDWLAIIDTLNPDGEPSMRQDSKAGRKTEVVLFAGTVCELGKKHGIKTPVNDMFLEKIQ